MMAYDLFFSLFLLLLLVAAVWLLFAVIRYFKNLRQEVKRISINLDKLLDK
ncbi:MAG: hypothetical protein Q4A31_11020 [Corynebacterium sp.]|uniref:hypothetical protein n=1 Tax=Corynebacterium sp. TaxID=1720 RepID=UPI0026DCA71F|nr:hypothetical protein [Corynebacterium sp.]MDO4762441.1 hypothetical protein [Corynebacterium sp.]